MSTRIVVNPFEVTNKIDDIPFPSSGIIPNMGNTLDGAPVLFMNAATVDKTVVNPTTSGLKPSTADAEKLLEAGGQLNTLAAAIAVKNEVDKKLSSVSGTPTVNPLIGIIIFIVALLVIVYMLKQS